MCDGVKIWSPVIYFYILLKLGHKVYKWIHKETLALINTRRACEVFHDEVILFAWAVPQVTR